MKTYLRLLAFAKPFGSISIRYFIFSLLSIIFGLVNFTLVIPLLNVLFGNESGDALIEKPSFSLSLQYFLDLFGYYFNQVILEKGTVGALTFIVVLLIASSFLKNATRYLALRIEAQTRARVVKNVRQSIYYKVIGMNTPFLFSTTQRRPGIQTYQ